MSESKLMTFRLNALRPKIRVVIELMSPGCAHKDKIADDQQDGANQRPDQEPPLNDLSGQVAHPQN